MTTGDKVGGRTHSQKAKDYIEALTTWLDNNPEASATDRDAAEHAIRDMTNALEGK